MNDRQPWLEGWRAVRKIKHYDHRKGMGEGDPGGGDLLDELDQVLRPKRLADEVRNYVLTSDIDRLALDDELDSADEPRLEDLRNGASAGARELGVVVADEPDVLEEISLELFTARTGYLYDFGRGVTSKRSDVRALWDHLVECFRLAGDRAVQFDVLCGVFGRYSRP